MKSLRLALVLALLSTCGLAAWAQDAAVRIRTDAVVDTRIPIAVPSFGCTPGLEAIAKEMTEVVRFDLEITGSGQGALGDTRLDRPGYDLLYLLLDHLSLPFPFAFGPTTTALSPSG